MQTIEAAVHRWDAENAIGAAQPVEAEPAVDAVGQTFEVMAPAWRARKQAPPGSGERFRFRQTDGTGNWTAQVRGRIWTPIDVLNFTRNVLLGRRSGTD
jgi:hypothetical protein